MANHVTALSWPSGDLINDPEFASSGLDLGPSGYRDTGGNYGWLSQIWIWTSTQSGGANAWKRLLFSTNTQVDRATFTKANGFSVRCVKD